MILTHVGNRGDAADPNADGTVVVAVTAVIAIGQFVVVRVVTSGDLSVSSGATSLHSTVTDSQGHTWTKQAEVSHNTGSFSGTVSLWTTRLTAALGVSDTVTCTFSSSQVGRGIAVDAFDPGAVDNTVAIVAVASGNGTDDAPTVTVAPTSGEYTWIGAGAHGMAAVTLTPDADYTTDRAKLVVVGGGHGNSASLWGQYRTLTAATDTWATPLSGDRPWGMILMAVAVTEPPPPPPPSGTRQFQADFETATHGRSGTSTTRRPDAVSLDYLTAFSYGPVAVADLSEGSEARAWYARVQGLEIWLCRANAQNSAWEVAETLLFTIASGAPLDEIDFCFDSVGRPVVVGERASGGGPECVICWYDDAYPAQVLSSLGLGRTPRCCFDVMPASPDPDICPPDPEVQVVLMRESGGGLVRRQETDRYDTDYPSPLADDPNIYLEDFFPTLERTLRVIYSTRTPATGTYELLRLDSMPYLDHVLLPPTMPPEFNSIVWDEGQMWRSPGTPTTTSRFLRVGLPDAVDEVQVAAATTDFGITGWQLQQQVRNAVAELGPGWEWPAGGFLDFTFSIDHGGGTMSPRAFRARTKKTIDGHECYSPWSYWFAGRQGENLVNVPAAYDDPNKVETISISSSDGGFWVQYLYPGTAELTEVFVAGPGASGTFAMQQLFDPGIGGGWRTPYRISIRNTEGMAFTDLHASYSFTLHSRIGADASSATPLGGIPTVPDGDLQTPQVFPPLP